MTSPITSGSERTRPRGRTSASVPTVSEHEAVVETGLAEAAADALAGPPVESHVSRAYAQRVTHPHATDYHNRKYDRDARPLDLAAELEASLARAGCLEKVSFRFRAAVEDAGERVELGVSPRAAVEDISCEYSLTSEEIEDAITVVEARR